MVAMVTKKKIFFYSDLNTSSANVRENACIILFQTKARKQSIYKNYIHATVGDTGSIPVNNGE